MSDEAIPEDVMKAATVCAETVCRNLDYDDCEIEVLAIASAILAERVRCAKAAFDEETTYGSGQGLEWLLGYTAGRQAAASSIRSSS